MPTPNRRTAKSEAQVADLVAVLADILEAWGDENEYTEDRKTLAKQLASKVQELLCPAPSADPASVSVPDLNALVGTWRVEWSRCGLDDKPQCVDLAERAYRAAIAHCGQREAELKARIVACDAHSGELIAEQRQRAERAEADNLERQDCAARELGRVQAHLSNRSDVIESQAAEIARLKAIATEHARITTEVYGKEFKVLCVAVELAGGRTSNSEHVLEAAARMLQAKVASQPAPEGLPKVGETVEAKRGRASAFERRTVETLSKPSLSDAKFWTSDGCGPYDLSEEGEWWRRVAQPQGVSKETTT
jgi:hypothetical protein